MPLYVYAINEGNVLIFCGRNSEVRDVHPTDVHRVYTRGNEYFWLGLDQLDPKIDQRVSLLPFGFFNQKLTLGYPVLFFKEKHNPELLKPDDYTRRYIPIDALPDEKESLIWMYNNPVHDLNV